MSMTPDAVTKDLGFMKGAKIGRFDEENRSLPHREKSTKIWQVRAFLLTFIECLKLVEMGPRGRSGKPAGNCTTSKVSAIIANSASIRSAFVDFAFRSRCA